VKGGRRFVNMAKSGRVTAPRRTGGAARGRLGMAAGRDVSAKKMGPPPAGPRTRRH
jgi:hypothetical protein